MCCWRRKDDGNRLYIPDMGTNVTACIVAKIEVNKFVQACVMERWQRDVMRRTSDGMRHESYGVVKMSSEAL